MTTPFKVIVKRLPTGLKHEDFNKSIEAYIPDIQYNYFIPGKSKFFL